MNNLFFDTVNNFDESLTFWKSSQRKNEIDQLITIKKLTCVEKICKKSLRMFEVVEIDKLLTCVEKICKKLSRFNIEKIEIDRIFEIVEIDKLIKIKKLTRVEIKKIEINKLIKKTCKKLKFAFFEIMIFHNVKCNLNYVLQICENFRNRIIQKKIKTWCFSTIIAFCKNKFKYNDD